MPAPASSSQSAPVKRHHGLVRLAHWLNALLLLGMIGSGGFSGHHRDG